MEPFDALERRLAALRWKLVSHPLYAAVRSPERLRRFMEAHVYAVWDFMSLLKRLQRDLTSLDVPWTPPRLPAAARFANEIVLAEESDLAPGGRPLSHLELYLEAMAEVGADTAPFERFLGLIRGGTEAASALELARAPGFVRPFVADTLSCAREGSTVGVAAAFLFGREDVIPAMFARLLEGLDPKAVPSFAYYLRRHIEIGSGQHAPLARRLLLGLAGKDLALWEEARVSAAQALRGRLRLWDELSRSLAEGAGEGSREPGRQSTRLRPGRSPPTP